MSTREELLNSKLPSTEELEAPPNRSQQVVPPNQSDTGESFLEVLRGLLKVVLVNEHPPSPVVLQVLLEEVVKEGGDWRQEYQSAVREYEEQFPFKDPAPSEEEVNPESPSPSTGPERQSLGEEGSQSQPSGQESLPPSAGVE